MMKEPGEMKTYVHLYHQIRKPACNRHFVVIAHQGAEC